jgi:hypothetical protein
MIFNNICIARLPAMVYVIRLMLIMMCLRIIRFKIEVLSFHEQLFNIV